MLIFGSHKGNKFIYIHIPKNGGNSVSKIMLPYVWSPNLSNVYDYVRKLFPTYFRSSIKELLSVKGQSSKKFLARQYLLKFKGIKSIMPARVIKEKIGDDLYNSSFVFSVSRNPYTRELSKFKFVKNCKKHHNYELFNNFKDFNDYIDFIYARFKEGKKKLQKSFVVDKNENIIVDKIIKLENISEEFEEITKKLDLPNNVQIPHLNRTSSTNNWVKSYSKGSLEKVREIFSEDFEFFNYDKSI